MKYISIKLLIIVAFTLADCLLYAQSITLDNFENTIGWSYIKSDGVDLKMNIEKGLSKNAIRIDYDFTQGTGYGGIQKLFPIDLPENYEFTFFLKSNSPSNNFEIKFIDKSGENVWWVNNRNYNFPSEWKKIKIKKRHIAFAWGPTDNKNINRVDRIEFTIASFLGGKGTIWLDDLKFEKLPAENSTYPAPLYTASSSTKNHLPFLMNDKNESTFWQSNQKINQSIIIDFQALREFGGLHIQWMQNMQATAFEVQLSNDGKNWEHAYTVLSNESDISFIRLPEAEAKFVKLYFPNIAGKNLVISEINILETKESVTPNDFLIYCSQHSPSGYFPRYFSKQASFWTITGVNNDAKEALINEDGLIEVEKGLFSIEPIIKLNDSVYKWNNVSSKQMLGAKANNDFTFEPTVAWEMKNMNLTTAVSSVGQANKNSDLNIRYILTNTSSKEIDVDFYLLIRPYQVNPYYQWLNNTGGVGKIENIAEIENHISVDNKAILFAQKYNSFGALKFDEGNPFEYIQKGIMPQAKSVVDNNLLASGIVKYIIHLDSGESHEISLKVPYYTSNQTLLSPSAETIDRECIEESNFWNKKTGHIKFNLPTSANSIINTYKSNLTYILINRDYAGIQPGSRSYERSWIRDGALTSSALLKSGISEEVKDFINWYSSYVYKNGKVPCVVDSRGPDPVPENDSHGELIYLIREYFNFTHDTAFLESKNQIVLHVVDYIAELISQRSTDFYTYGNDSVRALYGLVPESISHEGYSAKPMHSYWDNFFIMKGLKDAAEIQRVLGHPSEYEKVSKLRDVFKENLYNSLQLTFKNHNINYIPGCAELGDFDATSTTIALTPCNELINLPKPQIYNTFDKYYDFFKSRRDGKRDWINYTPYENRLIGSFILLDQPEKAHELIDFFLKDQHPIGWNQWAEVVWKNPRHPEFIGDMPHTWVGSDFINSIRSLFVYENEYDQSLVLAAALYQDWIDTPQGMSVENLPTYYGEISYSIKKDSDKYIFSISGNIKLPANRIKIKNFNGSKLPVKVTVNGNEIKDFNEKEIAVNEIPAEVVIYY